MHSTLLPYGARRQEQGRQLPCSGKLASSYCRLSYLKIPQFIVQIHFFLCHSFIFPYWETMASFLRPLSSAPALRLVSLVPLSFPMLIPLQNDMLAAVIYE